jgi:hypothetical protein
MRGAPTDGAFEALRAQLGGTAPNGLQQLEAEHNAESIDGLPALRIGSPHGM